MVHSGGASHLGGAFSVVEILNAVFSSIDIEKIKKQSKDRDRVILSKGHTTAALYATMFHYGLLSKSQINSYFSNGSLMSGHTSHFIENVEHSTGALGHGLPVGLGIALGSKAKKFKNRTYVILGDAELHEGSNWEAIMYAGYNRVNNLCLLIDKNRIGQLSSLEDSCGLDPLGDKMRTFHFDTYEIADGHDYEAISHIIKTSRKTNKPTAIICNTVKGKGVSFMEGDNVWHYRTPRGSLLEKAKKELEG